MTFCVSNRVHKLDHAKKDTGLSKTCVFYGIPVKGRQNPVCMQATHEAICLIDRAIFFVGNTTFAIKIRIDPIPPFLGVLSLMLQPRQHLFIDQFI